MEIPAFSLERQIERLRPELTVALDGVLSSGHFILGENVAAFETEMATFCGVRHAVGVASGTDALVLTLDALGIRAGDEVVTSTWSFFATAEAIARLGAIPVFVDIDPRTFNLRPEEVEAALSDHTRALLPVHIYGQTAAMGPLLELAAARGIPVVEDACQAIGAVWQGLPAGSLGTAGCLSFFPTKNLGCFGDGGMVLTNDAELAGSVRRLRVHGATGPYVHASLGYTSRLDELQAAVLRVKLRHLPAWIERRRALAARYTRALAGSAVTPPLEAAGCRHAYHQYVVRTPQRDALQAYLRQNGVGSTVYYPLPLHRQPAFAYATARALPCPTANACAQDVLALPLWPELEEAEVDRVVELVLAGVQRT